MNKEKNCALIIFLQYCISLHMKFFLKEVYGTQYYVERGSTFSRKKEDKEIEERYDKCQPFLLYVLYNTECEK